MQAVHFGAGNIGRGFIGSLLYQSGYETCFIDVNSEIVDLINKKQAYTVQLANVTHDESIVKNVRAINSAVNPELVIEAVGKADLVTAAVGPNILPHIADLLAKGLQQRLTHTDTPLTIIACENMIGGSAFLKEKVYEHLSEDEKTIFDQRFSFPNAAVDRIVPNEVNEDKLLVKVEPFYEWVVETAEIIGENPPVEGITFVENLEPFIERKLFTVNTGHATAAYLGYQANIDYIHEALANEDVKATTEKVLQETGRLLVEKYQFDEEEHNLYIQKIIGRFANPFITDETTRVGRSPVRKLQSNDRFIGPAQQYYDLFNEVPENLVSAIAAAFRYDFAEDPDAVEIQTSIQGEGIEVAIEKLTGLKPESALFAAIEVQYNKLG
ncbi:mannitol-1-phosphate 5-dehydrogenase [Sporosarcina sp. Marseille-Q4063]|uniref:mannitol-1-phosphate 5-dehydrogenase n=1 Tax=Sporosarcina sp. Marseille-Q4063 TaxID=2810514 RepID=UPI001BAF1823|nr:mannitol-1-phosphate 5-dehydrogenase [Sporosarcina sp. Marseille-Q4063]QUW22868.1 mannitol-1-phosphate 5-dehydrogenase [Sporosarcina sp. Marseille-Q4063]